MKTINLDKAMICILLCLFISSWANAQSETAFTIKVTYSKTGNINVTRLISLMPVPLTNEYQEISQLSAVNGKFFDINAANKILFYDGLLSNNPFVVSESFVYKSKPIQIDFNDKGNKNEVSGIDPNNYLGSDGTYIDLNNSTIKEIGDQLWKQSTDALDYARHCYEYVASNYSYINGSWRTLEQILSTGGGECGDFTTLFVNLARYKGIPARHNIGVWKNGGFHVWPDFYHEDYGWIPVDPTFKNSNPYADYFGRYDGDLIIVSQGLTSFSINSFEVNQIPLQTYAYWYWYNNGQGNITATYKASIDEQVNAINPIHETCQKANTIYNLNGMKLTKPQKGINIIGGRKVVIK